MEKDGMEILQVLYKDFSLKEVMETNFIGHLQKEFDNVKVVNIIIAFGEDEKSQNALSLIHMSPNHEKEKKLVIDTKNPEHLDKIVSVLKKYQSEE